MVDDIDLGIPDLTDVEVLGQGGSGVVYAATDTRFARRVAVKVLEKLTSESDRQQFDRECQVAGQLAGHPNVIDVYSGGYTADGRPYIVMQLVSGGTLADRLQVQGLIPWREAVGYVTPIARALAEAHGRDPAILHLDVKPENILLDGNQPQLTDFGTAFLRDTKAPDPESDHLSASLQHTAPETFEDQRDERSDIYSLASTLYNLVTGRPPHARADDETLGPLVRRLMHHSAPPLEPRFGPDRLTDLLQRGLARDPDHRHQTAVELIANLHWVLAVTDEGQRRGW